MIKNVREIVSVTKNVLVIKSVSVKKIVHVIKSVRVIKSETKIVIVTKNVTKIVRKIVEKIASLERNVINLETFQKRDHVHAAKVETKKELKINHPVDRYPDHLRDHLGRLMLSCDKESNS